MTDRCQTCRFAYRDAILPRVGWEVPLNWRHRCGLLDEQARECETGKKEHYERWQPDK